MSTTESCNGGCGAEHEELSSSALNVGDWVEVRSKEEILGTLDKEGRFEGAPFMPEMFAFCGQRMRVYRRAHKTCDTIWEYKGRKMKDAVHLEGSRCDGQAHGGCQAACMIFWKTAWLRPADQPGTSLVQLANGSAKSNAAKCTEADVMAATIKTAAKDAPDNEPAYACQATLLRDYTEPLPWWEPSQYIEDYRSGNVGLVRMAKSFAYSTFRRNFVNLGIGLGRPLKWLYNVFQGVRGGVPYPGATGKVPTGERTPTVQLNLQAGEWVRVKSQAEILATCDSAKTTNRGMTFDPEMVPYCGGTFQVMQRVTRIVNEKTGKMTEMKNACITLEGVICQARYSQCRLFCPRAVYPYWREIWLERVAPQPAEQKAESNRAAQSEPHLAGVGQD